jgi:pantoate--beta-alanine ligase
MKVISHSVRTHLGIIQVDMSSDLIKVRRSLTENDLTVMSIFVNPAQFAPHEDLASYPRTLPEDLGVLTALSVSVPDPSSPELSVTRKASAVFAPIASEMYPSGINQDVAAQKGTFVEIKGYSHQMEGQSRPTFFRGVATVVTKLFNVIQVSWGFPPSQYPAIQ